MHLINLSWNHASVCQGQGLCILDLIIRVSLSEPHTSDTVLRMCVYMCTCLCEACIWKWHVSVAVFSEVQNLAPQLTIWFCCLCVRVYIQCLWFFLKRWYTLYLARFTSRSLQRLSTRCGRCHLNMLCRLFVNGVDVCWLPGRNGPEWKLSVLMSARILPLWTLVMSCF